MQKILRILAATPLFNGLSETQLEDIRNIALDKFFNKGKTIFMEGDEGSGFYVVADGRVKVYKLSVEGKEHILHIYGPGNPIGEVPVFWGEHFPANALALVKSHLLYFPRKAFIDLIAANPSLSLNMLAVLSRRLREFTIQIENLSLKEVPGRLASYLIYLAKEQNQRDAVELTISKGQLASLLGTAPETLSRIFARMTAQGLIKVDGRRISFLDVMGVANLAEHGRLADG